MPTTRPPERGFTLIEIMIVVGIIGLLAALALVNFLKFQARAKQSEVRANLRAAYTAEQSYYALHQMYLESFDIIGFAPEFNNRYAYFGGGPNVQLRTIAGGNPPASGADPSCTSLSGVQYIGADVVKNYGDPGTALAVPVAARVANAGGIGALSAPGVAPVGGPSTGCCPQGMCEFLIAAAGNIDLDPTWDVWTISSQGGLGTAGLSCPLSTQTGTVGPFAAGEPVNECNDVSLY